MLTGDQITGNEQHLDMGAGDRGDGGDSPVPLQQPGTYLGTLSSARPMGFAASFGVTASWQDTQHHLCPEPCRSQPGFDGTTQYNRDRVAWGSLRRRRPW